MTLSVEVSHSSSCIDWLDGREISLDKENETGMRRILRHLVAVTRSLCFLGKLTATPKCCLSPTAPSEGEQHVLYICLLETTVRIKENPTFWKSKTHLFLFRPCLFSNPKI